MKWSTKGISILQGIVNNLVVPLPNGDEINSIDVDAEYTVEVKKKSKKRSLNANAYCWVLCQEIADRLTKGGSYTSKEDVYRKCVKECGNFTVVPIRNDAVERFKEIWASHGIGWLTDDMGDCRNTKGYSLIACYHGSSVYDVQEMIRLIECLLDEAERLGIMIKPKEEVQALLDDWGDKN